MQEVKINKFVFVLFLCYWTSFTYGQGSKDSLLFKEGVCDLDGYCIPRISGLGKAKGLEINYRNIFK